MSDLENFNHFRVNLNEDPQNSTRKRTSQLRMSKYLLWKVRRICKSFRTGLNFSSCNNRYSSFFVRTRRQKEIISFQSLLWTVKLIYSLTGITENPIGTSHRSNNCIPYVWQFRAEFLLKKFLKRIWCYGENQLTFLFWCRQYRIHMTCAAARRDLDRMDILRQ